MRNEQNYWIYSLLNSFQSIKWFTHEDYIHKHYTINYEDNFKKKSVDNDFATAEYSISFIQCLVRFSTCRLNLFYKFALQLFL